MHAPEVFLRKLKRVRDSRMIAGFTLLEAMIALMIVAVALPALLSLVMTQLDGSASIRDKTYAYWVAENQLTRINLLQQLKMQQKIKNYKLPEKDAGIAVLAGLRWQWQMKTIAMDTLPIQGFKRVEISVRILGLAQGVQMDSATRIDEDEPALARLTGYISDPEVVTQ
jgi:general secretion pathway protein I